MTNTQLISELLLELVMNKITYSPNFLYLKLVLLRFRVVCCIINYILLILNPISLHSVWLLNWGMNWTQVILFFFFFWGNLHAHPMGLEPTISPFILLLWEEKVPSWAIAHWQGCLVLHTWYKRSHTGVTCMNWKWYWWCLLDDLDSKYSFLLIL